MRPTAREPVTPPPVKNGWRPWQLLSELAEHELRFQNAFAQGVSSASSRASEVCDRFAERADELIREFQRRTLHLNRADSELYTRMIQLQSWFLEGIDRRIVQVSRLAPTSAPTSAPNWASLLRASTHAPHEHAPMHRWRRLRCALPQCREKLARVGEATMALHTSRETSGGGALEGASNPRYASKSSGVYMREVGNSAPPPSMAHGSDESDFDD